MKTFYILKYKGVDDGDLFLSWRFKSLKAAKKYHRELNDMFPNDKSKATYLKITQKIVK